jgi:hypothetical protein
MGGYFKLSGISWTISRETLLSPLNLVLLEKPLKKTTLSKRSPQPIHNQTTVFNSLFRRTIKWHQMLLN